MNTDLLDNINDMLNCNELRLSKKRREGLEGAKQRLENGETITQSQSGFYGAVKQLVLKDK